MDYIVYPLTENVHTALDSFGAIFLKAKMASAWTLMGRLAAALPNMGRTFVIGLRLIGWPALPRTFSTIMSSSVAPLARASLN